MNRFLILLVTMLTVSAFAAPEPVAPLVCSDVTTSTVAVTASSQTLSGYINGLQIVVTPAALTCTVSVATSGPLASRTLYSSTEATGSKFIGPVVQGSTNGVAVAQFGKAFLASEKLVVSASTSLDVTNLTVTVTPVIERQP